MLDALWLRSCFTGDAFIGVCLGKSIDFERME